MALLTKNRYLKLGKTRSQREFEFLAHAARAGVSVPRPLVYITRGYPLYRAWMVTQRVKGHNSFAALAMADPANALKLMPLISENIKILIKNRIFHVDLHPGNVLIDPAETPYIIDFDRARFTTYSPRKTVKLLRRRWKNAISKHHLPREISNLELD
jgi:3-deoxy-D-manno-octulosonic acid kinase